MKEINPRILVAAAAAAAIAVGVGVSYLVPRPGVKLSVEIDPKNNNNPPVAVQPEQSPPPPINPIPVEPAKPVEPVEPVQPIPIPERNIKASKPLVVDNGIEMVPSDVPITKVTKTAEENLQEAFGELVNRKSVSKNKPGDKTSSAIPVGTKLLSLKAKKSDIYVDLSEEFEKTDSTNNLQIRLAEVIYTATNLDHNAKVWLSVNGKKISNLGELEIRQPTTRSTLREDFPMIKGAR
jgi:hypothetical protein